MPHPPPITPPPAVELRALDDRGTGLIARRHFTPGETVLRCRALHTTPHRHAHSIQTGWHHHVEMDSPGIYANHACRPTVGVRDNDLGAYDYIALVPIAPGDEITFDYAMTEYEIAAPSRCLCGAPDCRGWLRGYREIGDEVRARYGDLFAAYLRTPRPE